MQNRSKTNWQESLKKKLIHFNNLSRLESVILQKSTACILVSTSYKVVNIISCECIHSIRLRWTSPNESQANRWSWPGNVMESWLFKPLSLSVSVILTQTEEREGGMPSIPHSSLSYSFVSCHHCKILLSLNIKPCPFLQGTFTPLIYAQRLFQ